MRQLAIEGGDLTSVTIASIVVSMREPLTCEPTSHSGLLQARRGRGGHNKLALDVVAQIKELFRGTDLSSRAIAMSVGVSTTSVRRLRTEYNGWLLANGLEVPMCGCGQVLHHPARCRVRNIKRVLRDGLQSALVLPAEDQRLLRERIVGGAVLREVAQDTDFSISYLKHYVTQLTAGEKVARRQQSTALRKARSTRTRKCNLNAPSVTNPWSVDLYAAIASLVPRAISHHDREDIISEAYSVAFHTKARWSQIPEIVGRAHRGVKGHYRCEKTKSLHAPDRYGRLPIDQLQAPDSETEWDDEDVDAVGPF